jgi:hypothetical protein
MAMIWLLKDGGIPRESDGLECPWSECVAKYGFRARDRAPSHQGFGNAYGRRSEKQARRLHGSEIRRCAIRRG